MNHIFTDRTSTTLWRHKASYASLVPQAIAAAIGIIGAIVTINPANASTFNFDYTFSSGDTISGTVAGDVDSQGIVSLDDISLVYSGFDSITFDQLNSFQASNELALDKSFIDVSAIATAADFSDFTIAFNVNQTGAAGVTIQLGDSVVQNADTGSQFNIERLNIASIDGGGNNTTTPEPTATIGFILVGGLVWGKIKPQQTV